MHIDSVLWAIALSLFIGAVGLPVPENPLLMGGGYAIFKQIAAPFPSLLIWYLAILLGDTILFAASHWFFALPKLTSFLKRIFGEKRMMKYQRAFAAKGGWTLFLARFAWGIRAMAYVAAGAARYPWHRFLIVDGLSVALQLVLFVGLGYFAGERVEWAEATSRKILILLGILVVFSLVITWGATKIISKVTDRQGSGALHNGQK